jgi:hypothetical protein
MVWGLSLAGGEGVVLCLMAWWVVLGGVLGSRFVITLYMAVWHVQGCGLPSKWVRLPWFQGEFPCRPFANHNDV